MTEPDKTPDQDPVEDIIAEQAAAKREGGDADQASGKPAANDLSSASMREQLEAAIAERDENKDMLVRGQAELENFRKRSRKELSDAREYQSLPLLADVLPCLDNLQRAIAAAETSNNIEELTQGIKMVTKQFEDVLSKHGAKAIECEGQPFDPNSHQALTQVPTADHEPMTIIQEVEKGYRLKDRVVRPSKVIVSCAPPAEAANEPTSDVENNETK